MDAEDNNVIFFNQDDPPNQPAADIRDYARQLSERRKLEDQKRKEDRFLRRSLRQSEKLRALAHAKKVAKDFKEVAADHSNQSIDSADEPPLTFEKIDYGDFIRELREKLRKYDSENGESSDIDDIDDREWEWLANKVSSTSVLQAFRLHDTIATALEEVRAKMGDLPMNQWAGDAVAIKSLDEVLDDLRHIPRNERSPVMNELYKILHSPQLTAALSSYDDVARVWSEMPEVKPMDEPAYDELFADDTVERTVYPSPVEGCYKILAVDDQGHTVTTPDGTTLVNVILQKKDEDFFGATVRSEGSAVVIGRIISGGLIERTGLLNEGDELLSVNGVDLMGKDIDHVSYILSSLGGHIDLLVAPIVPITEASLFQDEPVVICLVFFQIIFLFFNKIEEAGTVGISRDMAGLVPSPYFQRFRCLLRLKNAKAYAEDAAVGYSESEASSEEHEDGGEIDGENSSLGTPSNLSLWISTNATTTTSDGQSFDIPAEEYLWSSHGVGPKQLKKLRKKQSRKSKILNMVTGGNSGKSGYGGIFGRTSNRRNNEYEISKEIASLNKTDGDQLRQLVEESVRDNIRRPSLLTYELVDLYYPQPQRKRPLVLVGPKHVGRQQLIEGLLRSEPKRFAIPVIHTTNPEAKSTEFQQYQVITKQDFQQLHKTKAFVEWGVSNRHYYGTKVSSIESIVKAGKVCVIALRPDSIRAIRRTPFLPCVIFVSPPDNLDEMRKLSKQWIKSNANISDDELKACMEESQKMEQHYGHFFEFLIVPRSPDTALSELKNVVLELERRPQWVPAQWIDLAWQVAAQAMREHANSDKVLNENANKRESGVVASG
ncbi:unnamed protein product [Hymenolepis diminuta]|uniref:PDZ domain-containing protein n=1 Tax=Hymenolepis diminuta TaxID=6216 RepID=A0A0R3SRY8_HYMDI|nr:unnamed protein product [Hymenolepis diminuta]